MNAARLPSWSTPAAAPASPSGGSHQYQPQTPPKRPAKVAQMAQTDSAIAAFPTTKSPPTASPSVSRPQYQHLQQQQQQHPQRPLPSSRPTVKMAAASRSSNSVSALGSVRNTSSGLTNGDSRPQQQRRQQQQQQQQEGQRQREGVIRGVSNGSATVEAGVSRRSSGGTGVGVSVKPSASAGALAAAASASTAGARAGAGTRESGATSRMAIVQGKGHGRREGSVTSSDDGTVSEDSVEDHIQLFSGGGGIHLNNLPFGVPNRQGLVTTRGTTKNKGLGASSSPSLSVSASGREMVTGPGARARARAGEPSSTRTLSSTRMIRASPSPSSSSVISSYNAGGGETGGERVQGGGAKAMRIAARASIKVDGTMNNHPSSSISIPASSALGLSSSATSFGANLLSTSFSSSTSSSSLSWVSGTSSSKGSSIVVQLSPHPVEDDSGLSSPTTPTNFNRNNFFQIPPASFTPTTTATTATSPQLSTSSQTKLFKSTAALPGGSVASLVAAASKLAEENRRSGEAARTRRKIADLEISNASLLQVNQSLEATIRKQAAEMQELRMRIQSAPFELDEMLDEDSNSHADFVPFSKTFLRHTQDADNNDGDGDDDEEATTLQKIQEMRAESERQADLTFKRLCLSIEQMIFEARQALDQSTRPTGVKVLSSFDMYEKEAVYDDEDDGVDDDLDVGNQSLLLPNGFGSEEDDENKEENGYHNQIKDNNLEDYAANRARVRVQTLDLDLDSAVDSLNPGSLAHRPP